MKTATDPRHQNRIKIFQHLYSSAMQQAPDTTSQPIWDHLNQIDEIIKTSAPEWPIEKLNPVDLAILRLAIYELTVDKQAPYKVIIDEAVEIAKEFGSESSPSFINGALGKVISDVPETLQNES